MSQIPSEKIIEGCLNSGFWETGPTELFFSKPKQGHFDFYIQYNSSFYHSKLEEYFNEEFPKGFKSFGQERKCEIISTKFLLRYLLQKYNLAADFDFKSFYQATKKYEMCGSLTHTKNFVRMVLSKESQYIGIDTEQFRDTLQGKLWNKIATQSDQQKIKNIDSLVVRSLIFSAKESLFKFAFPFYQKYFGFHEAEIKHIDLDKEELTLSSEVLAMIGLREVQVDFKISLSMVHTLIKHQ